MLERSSAASAAAQHHTCIEHQTMTGQTPSIENYGCETRETRTQPGALQNAFLDYSDYSDYVQIYTVLECIWSGSTWVAVAPSRPDGPNLQQLDSTGHSSPVLSTLATSRMHHPLCPHQHHSWECEVSFSESRSFASHAWCLLWNMKLHHWIIWIACQCFPLSLAMPESQWFRGWGSMRCWCCRHSCRHCCLDHSVRPSLCPWNGFTDFSPVPPTYVGLYLPQAYVWHQ